ncbi:hypothetical protein E2C01_093005 [Portunus trituberculatus]|uniref:Uncharacterized protein n=1 Tax=Portunus trituberculatus TaxID=210409 RepID=A0A5B7JLR2_PORTR|nr:hypothetical protein [Portunus trituberculatus]
MPRRRNVSTFPHFAGFAELNVQCSAHSNHLFQILAVGEPLPSFNSGFSWQLATAASSRKAFDPVIDLENAVTSSWGGSQHAGAGLVAGWLAGGLAVEVEGLIITLFRA